MKLLKVLLSTTIVLSSAISFHLPAIAQRSYIVSVGGKTNEGDTLKYDLTSLDNYRGDYVNFTYYVIARNGDLRSSQGTVACSARNGWLATKGDNHFFWVNASSQASVNMLNSVCRNAIPYWNFR
ncbi:hypothetical protein [Dolichospermum phage Dfl-JY23]